MNRELIGICRTGGLRPTHYLACQRHWRTEASHRVKDSVTMPDVLSMSVPIRRYSLRALVILELNIDELKLMVFRAIVAVVMGLRALLELLAELIGV